MASKELTINFKIGIHGRPAALLVQKLKSYQNTEVSITKADKSANAKSLMGLLSLGINQGSTITINTKGENEEETADEIAAYIQNELAKEK